MIKHYEANSLEIDYLPVGEESKSGDAIALRFGHYEDGEWKSQTICIIDGGDSKSGEALVKHVKEVYKSNKVDLVILTHPDGDHASGLRKVLEELKVEKICMHRPWNHWADCATTVVDGRITKKSFGERLQRAYQKAYDIELIANEKKIKIVPPHQGTIFSDYNEEVLTILGPSKTFYISQLIASEKTPLSNLSESLQKAFSSNDQMAYETMDFTTEHLIEDEGKTSAENNMSLVLLLNIAGNKILFTADAGTQGLFGAIEFATANEISLKDLQLLHVPHHGSKRNLSKGILKYIDANYAIISSSIKGAPKHPSPIVINSLLRRNIKPFSTQGKLLNFHFGKVPVRAGLQPAPQLPFTNLVTF